MKYMCICISYCFHLIDLRKIWFYMKYRCISASYYFIWLIWGGFVSMWNIVADWLEKELVLWEGSRKSLQLGCSVDSRWYTLAFALPTSPLIVNKVMVRNLLWELWRKCLPHWYCYEVKLSASGKWGGEEGRMWCGDMLWDEDLCVGFRDGLLRSVIDRGPNTWMLCSISGWAASAAPLTVIGHINILFLRPFCSRTPFPILRCAMTRLRGYWAPEPSCW